MTNIDVICGPYGLMWRADYDLILAVGQDAADKATRKAGRAAWSDKDYDLAAEKVDALAKHAAERFANGGCLFVTTARCLRKVA